MLMPNRDRNWRNFLVIARREFLERVRTSWFIAVTVLGPIGMTGLVLLPAWLTARSANEEVKLQVIDRSGRGLGEELGRYIGVLHANFHIELLDAGAETEPLLALIRERRINGYLMVPADVLSGGVVVYRGDNATNLNLQRELFELVNFAVRAIRARDAGLSSQQIVALQTPVMVDAKHTTGAGEETSAIASFIIGYAVMFVLYMGILLYGVNVMRSVVVEKTNRVVELVISATRPRSLMLGKILGVGGVGLLQLSIWLLVGLLLVHFRGSLLGLFGMNDGGFTIPPLGLSDVLLALLFFLLGYFFYASLFAAVGAMVSSDQEAQQAQTPLVLLLIIPAACVQLVGNDPRGTIAQVLTLVPFTSPVLMPMRHLLDAAPPLEVAISVGILVLFTAGAIRFAGRIYRVGILMYGKRPRLGELARWLRYG
jgi:ABC-2 type transport system permease protein